MEQRVSGLKALAESKSLAIAPELAEWFAAEATESVFLARTVEVWRQKFDRTDRLKGRLETLCKELQKRNKDLTVSPASLALQAGLTLACVCFVPLAQEEIRKVSLEQQKQHKDLKTKFEASLEYVRFPFDCALCPAQPARSLPLPAALVGAGTFRRS